MRTHRGSLSLDKKLSGQYRGLFRNLGVLLLVMIAMATAAVVFFDKRRMGDLSRRLIASTTATVVAQLSSLFETEDNNLRIAVEQVQMAPVQDVELFITLFSRLSPFLNEYQNASGILVTELDEHNDYFGILKSDPEETELLVRMRVEKEWGRNKARLERWKDGEMLEGWFRDDDFDPKKRPWYRKTLEAEENEIVATEPYVFYTSNKPGITISTLWRKRGTSRHFITAIDILLTDITRISQSMRPTQNGVVFVFTQDQRLVGLPADDRLRKESAVNAALLKTIGDVDLPVLRAGVDKWEQHGRTDQSFPFEADGQSWWAGFEWIEDHPGHPGFWTGILVPENDFLGELSFQRNISISAIVGLGLILALILVLDTIRKMRFEVKEAVSHIGQKLGPFEVLYKIGDGGNGTVYRAKHALLKRPTAIKVMLPQYASSESTKQRFINEVQMTSSLAHPNTVAVFDFGQTPEGTLYYAMEHLNGVTLEDLVRISGPQPLSRVLGILYQICGSLMEAHAQGLIHRDIKPTNIMLCEHGGLCDVAKVLDFGLVKDVQQDTPDLTQENAIVGTPFYLAPELIADATAFSPASDLYALGGVAYYLLTGHNVFEGGSAMEICAMHLQDEPVPPSQRTSREIPSDLEAVVMACLAKQPEDRPQNAPELSEMLAQCDGFGTWTQKQAKSWWDNNRSILPVEDHHNTHSPLSNTQQLIDISGPRRS